MLFIDRTLTTKDFLLKSVNCVCGFTYYNLFFFKLLIEEGPAKQITLRPVMPNKVQPR